MKTILLLVAALLGSVPAMFANTSLKGNVTDDVGEFVILGNVVLYQDGIFISGVQTDFDGNYSFPQLKPGVYDMQVSYVGFCNIREEGLILYADSVHVLDMEMHPQHYIPECPRHLPWGSYNSNDRPIIEQDNMTSGMTISMDTYYNRIPVCRCTSCPKKKKKAQMVANTSLSGKVTDSNGEFILLGNVALYQKGVLLKGTETDFDGNYNFSKLEPGVYDIEFSYIGMITQRIEGIKVKKSKANELDAVLNMEEVPECIVLCCFGYEEMPDYEADNLTSGSTISMDRDGYLGYMDRRYPKKPKGIITSDQIKNLPTRHLNALAATTTSCATDDVEDEITIRSCRGDACSYYIDGVRVCQEDHHDENQQPEQEKTVPQYTPEVTSVICAPNPASSETVIYFPVEVREVVVYNMKGQIQGRWENLEHQTFNIAVANWPSGTYQIIALSKNQMYQSKLVVTRE